MTKLNWEASFFLITVENVGNINSFSSILNCGTNLALKENVFYINLRPAGGGGGLNTTRTVYLRIARK